MVTWFNDLTCLCCWWCRHSPVGPCFKWLHGLIEALFSEGCAEKVSKRADILEEDLTDTMLSPIPNEFGLNYHIVKYYKNQTVSIKVQCELLLSLVLRRPRLWTFTIQCEYCIGRKRASNASVKRDKPWFTEECKILYNSYKRALSINDSQDNNI
jgi:hypothetical protein